MRLFASTISSEFIKSYILVRVLSPKMLISSIKLHRFSFDISQLNCIKFQVNMGNVINFITSALVFQTFLLNKLPP